MIESLPEETHDLLAMGICPDCAMPGLRPGPQGGTARNEACSSCGAEFNVARWGGEVAMAHRNSPRGQPNWARLASVFGIFPSEKHD